MQRIRLTNTCDSLFLEAWELYETAFPEQERRQLPFQEEIMKHPDYHFDVITQEGVVIGFLLWWQFKGVRFIEHLATSEASRGKGYGKHIVEQFMTEGKDPLILEVELPQDELSQRRIAFYQRLGCKLNTYHYEQLPLQKGSAMLPLYVMSYPNHISQAELDDFQTDFKQTCYTPYLDFLQ